MTQNEATGLMQVNRKSHGQSYNLSDFVLGAVSTGRMEKFHHIPAWPCSPEMSSDVPCFARFLMSYTGRLAAVGNENLRCQAVGPRLLCRRITKLRTGKVLIQSDCGKSCRPGASKSADSASGTSVTKEWIPCKVC